MKSYLIRFVLASSFIISCTGFAGKEVWQGSFYSSCYNFSCLCGLIEYTPVKGNIYVTIDEDAVEDNVDIKITYSGFYKYGESIEKTLSVPSDKWKSGEMSLGFAIDHSPQYIGFKIHKYQPAKSIIGKFFSFHPSDGGDFRLEFKRIID